MRACVHGVCVCACVYVRVRVCMRELQAESLGGGPGAAWLGAISSNQAKANYKFNSELCAGDN